MKDRILPVKPIDVDSIPAAGHIVRIEADADARAAIAAEYGLVGVNSFVAELEIGRQPNGSVTVEGRVRAEIVQNCVVSLEPVVQTIDEPISMRYVAEGDATAPAPPKPGAEVHIDPDVEPPDVLGDGTIDPGAVALEHMALAIDPYPRAPGAEIPTEFGESPENGHESPFSVLAKLARTTN
ncbi:MAG: DUF177 domain-containing protein [Bauldia sp.]|nr:DUF177 domain-containing protein [Bauldia sp.]